MMTTKLEKAREFRENLRNQIKSEFPQWNTYTYINAQLPTYLISDIYVGENDVEEILSRPGRGGPRTVIGYEIKPYVKERELSQARNAFTLLRDNPTQYAKNILSSIYQRAGQLNFSVGQDQALSYAEAAAPEYITYLLKNGTDIKEINDIYSNNVQQGFNAAKEDAEPSFLEKVLSTVLPIAVTNILAPGLGSAVGSALGVSSAAGQALLGQAAAAGLNTAIQGGNLEDVVKAAATAAAGTAASNAVGSAVSGAIGGTAGTVAGAAASSATRSGIRALIMGDNPNTPQDEGDVLNALFQGAITGGVTSGVSALGGEYLKDLPTPLKQALISATTAKLLGGDPKEAFVKAALNALPEELKQQQTNKDLIENAYSDISRGFDLLPESDQFLVSSLAEQDIAAAQNLYSQQTGGARLTNEQLRTAFSDPVRQDPFAYVDNLYTTEAEARNLWRQATGEEPSSNQLSTLIGLNTQNVIKQAEDFAYDRDTTDSSELEQFVKDIAGTRIQYTPEQQMDLLGLPEAQAQQRIRQDLQDWELNKRPTEGSDIEQFLSGKNAYGFQYSSEQKDDLLGMPVAQAKAQIEKDYSNYVSDQETTDSSELENIFAAARTQHNSRIDNLFTEEQRNELLGLPEQEVKNRIATRYNEWFENFNTVTGEEAQAQWRAAGNTRPMTAEDLIQMVAGNQASAETYAQRMADYEQVVYNGSQYATREQAQQAAKEQGGYQQYSYNGRVYPTDQEVPYNPYADNVSSQSDAMLNAIRAGKTSYEWGDKVYKVNNNYTDAIKQINEQPTWALAQAKAQELLGPGAPFSYRDQGSFITSVSVSDVVKQVAPNMINPEEVPLVFDASNYTDRLQAARAAAALSKDHFTFSDGKTYQISSDFRDWLTKTQIAEKELAELGSPFNGTKYSTKAQAAIAANADGAKVFTFSDGKTYRVPDNMAQLMMPNETFAEMQRLIEQNTTLVNAEKLKAAADFNESVLGKLFPTGPERELAAQFMAGSGEALRGVIGTINGLRHAVDDAMWSVMPAEWKKAYEYGILISPYDTPRERLAKLEQVKQLEAEGVQPQTLSGGLSIDKDSAIYKFSKKLIDTGALNSPEVQKQQQQITEFLKDVPAYEKPAALMAIVNNGNWLGALGYLSNEIPQELPGLLAGGIFAKAGKLGVGALTSATIDAVIDGGQAYINRMT